MFDSSQPHGLQPTRLLRLWDFLLGGIGGRRRRGRQRMRWLDSITDSMDVSLSAQPDPEAATALGLVIPFP